MKKNIKISTLYFVFIFMTSTVFAQLPVPIEKGDLWGYNTEEGKTIIESKYLYAGEFSKYEIAAVVDSIGWAYINTKGEVLLRPFIFDNGPDYFSEGLARFVENNKIGFFDKRGNKIIAAVYDFALPFSENKAVVCNECEKEYTGEHYNYTGGKWGYINKNGEIIIPLQYEDASPFESDKAQVKLGKWYYITPNGEIQD